MGKLEKLLIKTQVRLQKGQGDPDFFELLRSIEQLRPDLPKIGTARTPEEEAVRLGQTPYLNFPKTTLSAIATESRRDKLYTILVYFMGFCGVNGPLPLETTHYIHQRANNYNDHSLRKFLDIFNHRLISLFYRAFAANEFAVNFDRKEADETCAVIEALSGCGATGDLPPYTSLSLLPFLMNKNRSAKGLKYALYSFFGLHFEVKEHEESIGLIPKEARCRLGICNTTLGTDAQLGRHYYTCTKAVTLTLGTVDYAQALNFMPGGQSFKEMSSLLRLYLQQPLTVFFDVIIKADTIPRMYLGKRFRLSRSVFLQGNKDFGNKKTSDALTRKVRIKLNLKQERFRFES